MTSGGRRATTTVSREHVRGGEKVGHWRGSMMLLRAV